jgi:hypothetical protein
VANQTYHGMTGPWRTDESWSTSERLAAQRFLAGGEADACARILDDLDQELTSRVGADRLHQLQDLLAEVTNVLHDSTLNSSGQR